jgi:hypothetical protein
VPVVAPLAEPELVPVAPVPPAPPLEPVPPAPLVAAPVAVPVVPPFVPDAVPVLDPDAPEVDPLAAAPDGPPSWVAALPHATLLNETTKPKPVRAHERKETTLSMGL